MTTPAEDAVREFPFWDYSLGDVDPRHPDAEWVPDLAEEVEAAVRAQAAGELLADAAAHRGRAAIPSTEPLQQRALLARAETLEAAAARLTRKGT